MFIGLNMTARPLLTITVLAVGYGFLVGLAQAQAVFPAPYSYPAPDHRGATAEDDDDIMSVLPEDDEQEGLPDSRLREAAPYPGPGRSPAPYYEQAPREIRPQPGFSDRYGERPYEGAIPRNDSLRPPAVIEANRPPAEVAPARPGTVAALPPEDQPEEGEPKELPPQFKRQVIDYLTKEPPGTIIIDTPSTYLYYILGGGKAVRYGIGVGREGFTWAGTEKISRLAEWPDWHPPAEMIERQPYLPRFMAGGAGNPLGARALYLGKTIYRIHGTNQPSTIGKFVSSGCIRMLNEDVEDLYNRVKVGTRVVVLPGNPPATASTLPTAR